MTRMPWLGLRLACALWAGCAPPSGAPPAADGPIVWNPVALSDRGEVVDLVDGAELAPDGRSLLWVEASDPERNGAVGDLWLLDLATFERTWLGADLRVPGFWQGLTGVIRLEFEDRPGDTLYLLDVRAKSLTWITDNHDMAHYPDDGSLTRLVWRTGQDRLGAWVEGAPPTGILGQAAEVGLLGRRVFQAPNLEWIGWYEEGDAPTVQVYLLDAATPFEAPAGPDFRYLDVTPDHRHAAFTNADGTHLWDLSTGEVRTVHADPGSWVALHPAATSMFVQTRDYRILAVDVETGQASSLVEDTFAADISVSSDFSTLFVAKAQSGGVWAWTAPRGVEFVGEGRAVCDTFDADGDELLALGSDAGTLARWTRGTGPVALGDGFESRCRSGSAFHLIPRSTPTGLDQWAVDRQTGALTLVYEGVQGGFNSYFFWPEASWVDFPVVAQDPLRCDWYAWDGEGDARLVQESGACDDPVRLREDGSGMVRNHGSTPSLAVLGPLAENRTLIGQDGVLDSPYDANPELDTVVYSGENGFFQEWRAEDGEVLELEDRVQTLLGVRDSDRSYALLGSCTSWDCEGELLLREFRQDAQSMGPIRGAVQLGDDLYLYTTPPTADAPSMLMLALPTRSRP